MGGPYGSPHTPPTRGVNLREKRREEINRE